MKNDVSSFVSLQASWFVRCGAVLCLLTLWFFAVPGCSNPGTDSEPNVTSEATAQDASLQEASPQDEALSSEKKEEQSRDEGGELSSEMAPEVTAEQPVITDTQEELPPLRDGAKVKVRSVIDGDTVYVYPADKGRYPYYRIRLWGFNAPECYKGSRGCYKDKEYYGLEAGKALNSMLWKPEQIFTVSCPIDGKNGQVCKLDPYKRNLAYLLLPSGENSSVKMLRDGMGWVYTIFYPPLLKELCEAEAEAIRNKVGMWSKGREFVRQGMSTSTQGWYYHKTSYKTHDAICTKALGQSFAKLAGEE